VKLIRKLIKYVIQITESLNCIWFFA